MTMNSTISELVQDNSNVSPETNPIATIQTDGLVFGQKHNDIDCALCPSAKRACDRAWVTAKNLEEWSRMSKTTMWRRLSKLEEVGRICSVSDTKKWSIPHAQGGSTPTTFYRKASRKPTVFRPWVRRAILRHNKLSLKRNSNYAITMFGG